MRIALNAGSISPNAMSGIGHYTQCLLRALLHCRSQEALTLIGGNHLSGYLCSRHEDRLLAPDGVSALWDELELPELLSEGGASLYDNPAFGLPVIKSCPVPLK